MGKKKNKSKNNYSGGSNASFLEISDRASCADSQLPEKLVVSSVESAGFATYAKCMKTDFHNVCFINSLIMQTLGIEDLVIVEGDQNKILCNAFPVDSHKKALVVFPNSYCGFKSKELVMVRPYTETVKIAEEIVISHCDIIRDINQSIQDYILRLLCNKYIYIGMPISFLLLDKEYKFVIKNIIPSLDIANLNISETSCCESAKFYKVSYKTDLKLDCEKVENICKIELSNIGGLEMQRKSLQKHIDLFLGSKINSKSVFCGTVILQGPPGTGKSLLLQAITKAYSINVEYIWWYTLCAMSQSEIRNELESIFQRAIDKAPSLIVIDELNYFLPSKNESGNLQLYVSKLLQHFLQTLEGFQVMIISATNEMDFDESLLRTTKRIIDIIQIKIPSQAERFDILKNLLNSKKHELTCDQIRECAELAHGFTGKDLSDVLKDAEMFCHKRMYSTFSSTNKMFCFLRNHRSEVGPILYSDVKLAVKLKKPVIVAASDLQVKKVRWSDIGGMNEVKEKLKQLVEWPLKYPEAFKHFDITPSRGVLMYGPPGCSKTMIAKALATECELNFISKNAADLFDKYVGESEKAVRDLFAMAKAKAPCIIFLDEIDALVTERGSSSTSSGVGDRIVTTLLTEMDGIEELHGVIIIAATNRPDMLDDALVRNGRINNFIYVNLPDSTTREEILKINMKNRSVSEDFDHTLLSKKTEGYSGAEIVNICNEAALQLLSENPTAEFPVFTMNHFELALRQVSPRTSQEMITFYERFNEKHCTKA